MQTKIVNMEGMLATMIKGESEDGGIKRRDGTEQGGAEGKVERTVDERERKRCQIKRKKWERESKRCQIKRKKVGVGITGEERESEMSNPKKGEGGGVNVDWERGRDV